MATRGGRANQDVSIAAYKFFDLSSVRQTSFKSRNLAVVRVLHPSLYTGKLDRSSVTQHQVPILLAAKVHGLLPFSPLTLLIFFSVVRNRGMATESGGSGACALQTLSLKLRTFVKLGPGLMRGGRTVTGRNTNQIW
jgi:hypothetical protein